MKANRVTRIGGGSEQQLRARAGLLALLLAAALAADILLFKGQLRSELQAGAVLREPVHPELIARQARDAAERMVRNSLRP